MRRDALCIVLGLLLGAAPLAIGQGQDEEQLAERLRALQNALAKAMHRAPAVEGIPAVDARGYELAVVPVADLTAAIQDHYPPVNRLGGHKDAEGPLFGMVGEEALQPFGTIEEVMELVRGSVWPQDWEEGGQILAQGKNLVIHHKPAMASGVRTFLDRDLRPRSHRSVTVRAEIIEVSAAFHRTLTGLKDATLPSAKRFALDEAVKAKTAKVLFSGRVTGLLKQRVVLWHGRQVAVLADAEVEVAEKSKTTDPVVDVVQAGGYIWVRAVVSAADRVRLDIAVGLDELKEPIEQRETNQSGTLDMPVIATVRARTTIEMPVRTWAMVGNGVAGKDHVRILLVRGELLPRGRAKR